MFNPSVATQKLLGLSYLRGVGPSAQRKAARLPSFDAMPIEDIATAIPAVARGLDAPRAWQIALEQVEQQIEQAIKFDARILSPLDQDYPILLARTPDDPMILFVRGELAANPACSVAIVGTREPTEHGTVIARRIATFFSENSWSVVSGLALGCDAVAHQAALAAGGHTVAVLAHGLQTLAPARHKRLAQDILESGGALVSEFAFGQSPAPQLFVKRDRTQAGLAQGVIMVQSDVHGGSLHASRAAISYGRFLGVPYPTAKDEQNREPKVQANILLANGASEDRAALLRCSVGDLARLIILKGREQYKDLLQTEVEEMIWSTAPVQTSLF